MTAQVLIEFVIGFAIGTAVCLGKEFLLQRFILKGRFFATLLFWLRLVIDAGVMFAMYFVSIAALVGAALGLSMHMVILVVRTLREDR